MKVNIRLGLTLALFASHVGLALLLLSTVFPFARLDTRERLTRWWSRRLLAICDVDIRIAGTLAGGSRGQMVVSNHVSWMDIYTVHTMQPTRFVAKSEIRGWPVIGYLCDRTGTIFIERGKRRAVHQANQRLAEVLRDGGCVGIFPEGTTSEGREVLPFHANLIQAAIEAGVPVQPVAIRYQKPSGEIALDAAYVGDTSLFESLLMVIRGAPMTALATVLEPIETTGKTRHQVAGEARAAIALSLGLDIEDRRPASTSDLQGELL